MARKSIRRIRADYANNEAVVAIVDDVEQYAAISAVGNSEGGKLIIDGLVADVISGLDSVTSNYKTATHAELMGTCAGLKANLDLLRVLTRAHKNKNLAQDALEEAIKE